MSAKPQTTTSNPPVIDMETAFINSSKDREGTLPPNTKPFLSANYGFHVDRTDSHTCRGIVHAAEKGVLVRGLYKSSTPSD
ncbi:linker histone H1 and H5 family protein [Opisthorchis viverrini]|uniref:Linker histone H1 and H5 family protein n=2 Tax=Opisthorchis viverrini TaxID=6198 RepID=A0A1S8WYW7_OPIVI|nr:hypothetical protein T265_04783 [Opisthorchis viverrini]KER28404.1 hypothetical protein T265_04783 [Opisthorchis viverrini]OON19606.1 linker histone H1 and H5 family protein [Opisthorchis viverrini]